MSQPTRPSRRIVSIDILRGFALLGILVMNIQMMAMPAAAYFNPTVWGDLTGANRVVWELSHLLTDHKMMNIFSLLYGAGILLLTERLEQRGEKALRIHYTRTFWLLIIGLIHAYLIWAGDILVVYAVTALVVVLFRKMRPGRRFAVGIAFLAVASGLTLLSGFTFDMVPPEQAAALINDWQPDAATLQHEVDAYTGGWLAQLEMRVAEAITMHTTGLFFWGFWRAVGLMLMGMSLYQWGIFSAERSTRFYRNMLIGGLAVGLPLVYAGIVYSFANNWEYTAVRMGPGYQFNYWGSLAVSAAWIAGVMLIVKAGLFTRLTDALAAVGRTALTNYIAQSVIAVFIFYGMGLGLFGSVERTGQIAIVFAVWIVQLVISPIWLQRYRFGPLEWAWRSLTYWKLQPMRRTDGGRRQVRLT